MTENHKAAHDARLAGTIPTRATPRTHYSPETYTGSELLSRSARPGAYDAVRLPSRMGNRLLTPTDMRAELRETPPAPATFQITSRAPVSVSTAPPATQAALAPEPTPSAAKATAQSREGAARGGYNPQPGSKPAQLIAALQAEGGYFTYAQICERFGVTSNNISNVYGAAIAKGALVRHQMQPKGSALSLPGCNMPAVAPVAAAATQAPSALHAIDTRALAIELEALRLQAAVVTSHVEALARSMHQLLDSQPTAAPRGASSH